ncbi:hypothetical protein [Actinoplanes cyaneus]|uniref:hypothetical protein n=1 Tax=Actinoplanes cyaneus TaxID=52696 RepID=UPI001942E0EB|nr:hypothetical protein [Actinoplanes cyaneus]
MEDDVDGWRIMERPGRLGSGRPLRVAEWDDTYGPGSWRLAWLIAGQYHDGNASLSLYEDAYFHLLHGSAETREALVSTACDVFVHDPSDTAAGLDYRHQDAPGHHLEDIAIRRCLVRLGVWFRGDQLVRLGGVDKDPDPGWLRSQLSPHRLPFHRPDLLVRPELTGWWLPGSVESFYQSNKFLLARAEG